jgi:transposase-like protein
MVEAAEEEKERLRLNSKNARDDAESARVIKQGKHCPKCMAPYEKNGGCANMHCAKCGHGFKDPG